MLEPTCLAMSEQQDVQGCLAHKTPPPPYDPTVALCLGTYGDPMGVGLSYERGTPEERGHVRWSRPPVRRDRYRGTSLIRNRNPHRTAIGPYAYVYCRVLGVGVSL